VIAWQTREEVSRRLGPAQASALGEHGIYPSSIPAGRVVAIGRHHGIFLKPLSTAPVHFIAVIPEIDIWRAAQLMLKRYGDQALEESSSRADELALADDHDGAATWHRIMTAVTWLTNTTPPGRVH
jgi:hypothetical protein